MDCDVKEINRLNKIGTLHIGIQEPHVLRPESEFPAIRADLRGVAAQLLAAHKMTEKVERSDESATDAIADALEGAMDARLHLAREAWVKRVVGALQPEMSASRVVLLVDNKLVAVEKAVEERARKRIGLPPPDQRTEQNAHQARLQYIADVTRGA